MRVFLSSTGRDLKDYRDAAYDAIQRLDEFKCIRMEDFRGPAVPAQDFDAQKVADCDLFVMILGHLHGNCPDGNEKSYTELEYETAVSLNPKKPVFLFLAPEDFPLPANLYESDAKRARQRALRDRAVGLIRSPFTSPADLAAGIVQAIHNWQGSPSRSALPGSFLPLPPQPYFAHPYPLQENFTGRVAERRILTEWLQRGRNVLSIEAIGGMGKSALTWAWVQRDLLGLPLPGLAERDGEDCRVPEAARPEGVLWWSFYEEKASFGAFAGEAFRYASDGQPAPESTYELLRGLANLLARKRLLLVLDGFEREQRAYASLNAAYQEDDAREDADVRACIDQRRRFSAMDRLRSDPEPRAAHYPAASRRTGWPGRLRAKGAEGARTRGRGALLSRAGRPRDAGGDPGGVRALWIPSVGSALVGGPDREGPPPGRRYPRGGAPSGDGGIDGQREAPHSPGRLRCHGEAQARTVEPFRCVSKPHELRGAGGPEPVQEREAIRSGPGRADRSRPAAL
jgi:Domain of unknown function (DUF4062)